CPGEVYLPPDPRSGRGAGGAAGHGATVLTGEPGRVVGLATASGAVRAVRTADGQLIPVDAVVCCAGRWTPEVVALVGAAGPVPLVPWASPGAAAPGLVVQAGPVTPAGPTRVV